jgi:hypothetical protein
MPNRIILEVGTKSVEVPLGGTPTQILNVLRRYVRTANLPVAPDATPEDLATAILQGFKAQVIAGPNKSTSTNKWRRFNRPQTRRIPYE